MTVEFQVDIGRLLTLRSRLCALHGELAGGVGASSSSASSSSSVCSSSFGVMRANLDPRNAVFSDLVRANRGSLALSAYGSLNESDPLGEMHNQVAESVLTLVNGLQELVEAMISAVGTGGARYVTSEDSVFAAVAAVADGGGGAGSGLGPAAGLGGEGGVW